MRDLVDEGIAAGCLEWVPDDLRVRQTATHRMSERASTSDDASTAREITPTIGGTPDNLPVGGPAGVTGRASKR